MSQNPARLSGFIFLNLSLLLLVLLTPILLANRSSAAILADFVLVLLFFFPGYLSLTLFGKVPNGLRILLSPIAGIVSITTVYNLFALASIGRWFPYLAAVVSVAGIIAFASQAKGALEAYWWTTSKCQTLFVGSMTALCFAPLLWRSGRFSGDNFVFYGPAGQDPLFHVTLLQRLLHHVPPDNFIVSGVRQSVYHYFNDLALALVLRTQSAWHFGAVDLFDLYYRSYPIVVYFFLGALAYRAGRQMLKSARGGVLSVLLLFGAGGLGWFFGGLQTIVHASDFAAMRAALFSDWASWDGVNSILPLIHRPAHYHGLLICLAAINLLVRSDRSRRDWILAGLLLGLMAGFNFTLAATFGAAAVLACLIFILRRGWSEARDLAWFSIFLFLGSVPVLATMLLSGLHSSASGFPFRGPDLQFPVALWGPLLGRMMPGALVPWVALMLFPVVAYGVKLFGLGALARLDIGEERHRAIAMVFAIVLVVSFVIGTFFSYHALGGVGVVFLQPTSWILGLFALHPIDAWLERNRGNWLPIALWVMLGLIGMQSLGAYNFSYGVAFDRETVRALQDVRLAAEPDDVVAYLPGDLDARPIWGHAEESTNFSIMAMTGLDGYVSNESYSTMSTVSGVEGNTPAEVLARAKHFYERRNDDVQAFMKGHMDVAASARLAQGHVRWIIVEGQALRDVSSIAVPWRRTREIAVYRLEQ